MGWGAGILGIGAGAILERKRLGGLEKKGSNERGQTEKGLGQVGTRGWQRVGGVWEDLMVVVEHGRVQGDPGGGEKDRD